MTRNDSRGSRSCSQQQRSQRGHAGGGVVCGANKLAGGDKNTNRRHPGTVYPLVRGCLRAPLKRAGRGHTGKAMHRAVSMRLGPLPCPTRVLLRRPAGRNGVVYASAPGLLSTRCALQQPRPRPPSAVRAKGICSTAPAWKGRRGGASALMPKNSGRFRRKAPGAGKKKKPKVCVVWVGMRLDSKLARTLD